MRERASWGRRRWRVSGRLLIPSAPPHSPCTLLRSNGKAARALTDIGSPAIDWVALAGGMGVPASRATTAEELAAALAAGLQRSGPTLIEAVL